jgi:predicted enzyme related to lactoylglutathione lyase
MDKQFNPVGWFEIPVKDMARAKAFYEHLFKIQLEEHDFGPIKMAWFPMFEGAIGAAGSLVLADGYTPSTNGALVYFTAPDIEAHQERVKEKGGQILAEKFSIGEFGFIAMVQDTEGNRIGLHSRIG